jgi:hypothetical protein
MYDALYHPLVTRSTVARSSRGEGGRFSIVSRTVDSAELFSTFHKLKRDACLRLSPRAEFSRRFEPLLAADENLEAALKPGKEAFK